MNRLRVLLITVALIMGSSALASAQDHDRDGWFHHDRGHHRGWDHNRWRFRDHDRDDRFFFRNRRWDRDDRWWRDRDDRWRREHWRRHHWRHDRDDDDDDRD